MSDPPRDDLEERVAELEETLQELRAELGPPRGPLGLPRPPTPREVLRFTDEYAIPAGIAILEANIRTLELLRGVIRATDRAGEATEMRDRTVSLGRETVARIDRALSELGSAIEEADLPRDAEARSLLEDARDLNAEIRDRVEATGSPRRPDEGGRGIPDEGDRGVDIDVESELEEIRDEIDNEDGERRDDGDGSRE